MPKKSSTPDTLRLKGHLIIAEANIITAKRMLRNADFVPMEQLRHHIEYLIASGSAMMQVLDGAQLTPDMEHRA